MEARPSFSSLLARTDWAMLPGERSALEGLLSLLRPNVSIELGVWHGGSLNVISRHSAIVHAFDLVAEPTMTTERYPNVTFHIGDCHDLLPPVLAELTTEETNVDFAFVDGDHTAHGVRRDLEDLLYSPATSRTVIVLHDTLNEAVRAGIEEVDLAAIPKVGFVDFDFVQGRVMREGPQKDDLWYGLGLVVTGWDEVEPWPATYSAPDLYDALADKLVAMHRLEHRLGYGQLVKLEHRLEQQKRLVELMRQSWSWRVTSPLRGAKRLIRRDEPTP